MHKTAKRPSGFLRHAVSGIAMGMLLAACQSGEVETQETTAPAIDVTAYTLPMLAEKLESGELSAVDVTQAYVERIESVDWDGPKLQSVLSLNPDALEIAKALDAKREAGETLGPLHGVPVLLKDNIESADNLATTAGALALADNISGHDSPLTAGLRNSGAIILGKTNLSQWANFRSNDSMSGWSAMGGQVRNPHMLDRNPCGSSSGSGSSVAASLAAGAVGTETNGSIICPSNANGVVGFKTNCGPRIARPNRTDFLDAGHGGSDDQNGNWLGHDAERHGDG